MRNIISNIENEEIESNKIHRSLSPVSNIALFSLSVFVFVFAEVCIHFLHESLLSLTAHICFLFVILIVFIVNRKKEIAALLFSSLFPIVYFVLYSTRPDLLLQVILIFISYIIIGVFVAELNRRMFSRYAEMNTLKENFNSLFENMTDGVLVCKTDGTIFHANKAAKTLFGLISTGTAITVDCGADVLTGASAQNRDHNAEGNAQTGIYRLNCKYNTDFFTNAMNSVRENKYYSGELSIVDKSGAPVYLNVSSIVNSLESEYIYIFFSDNTEKKQIQLDLIKSENKLKTLTNEIPELIFELDLNGKITYASRYSVHLLGYTPEELTSGMMIWDIVDESSYHRIKSSITRFINGLPVPAEECPGRTKNGETFTMMVHMNYIYENGTLTGIRGIAVDITQLKKVEDQLITSQKRYKNLFENSNYAVIVHNLEGKIYNVNGSLCSMLGYSREALLKMNLSDIYPEESLEYLLHSISDSPVGKNVVLETNMTRNDGMHVISETSISQVSPGIDVYQSVIRDITESKRAQESIIESERRYRSLNELMPQNVFEIDLKGNLTFLNRNGMNTFKISPERLSEGICGIDLFAIEEHDRVKESFEWAIAGNDSHASTAKEYVAQRFDGTKFPYLVYATPVINDGVVESILCVGIDITSRKRMEEELRVNEERLNLAITGAGVCVWDWDMESDRMYFSGNYENMFAYPPENTVHNHIYWKEILQVQFFSEIMKFYGTDTIDANAGVNAESGDVSHPDTTPNKHTFTSEYHLRCRDGSYKWISIMGHVAEWDRHGIPVPTRIVGIMQDITRIKQYQNALSEANKKLNLLSSITRHDILNQIAGINGFTDLLLRSLRTNPDYVHHLERIRQASQNIQEQITFTKDYQSVGVESPQWQSVEEILVRLIEPAEALGIKLMIDCKGIEIYADPMLERIFFNLIDNASRHGGHVTEINVTFKDGREVGKLIIEDNGVGVPEKIKNKIFDHGFGTHTGLGLFLTKEILSITCLEIVENGTEGKGARFEITMPRDYYKLVNQGY